MKITHLLFAFVALGACNKDTTEPTGPVSELVPITSLMQSGTAGTPVGDPPKVRVIDPDGRPIPGVTMTFTTDRPGFVPLQVKTNGSGIGGIKEWRLPLVPGRVTGTITYDGLPPVNFTVDVLPASSVVMAQ